MVLTDDVRDYIITFLLGNSEEYSKYIRYETPKEVKKGMVYIIPSAFFSKDVYLTKNSLPQEKLPKLNNIQILFGNNHLEKKDGAVICDADLIASTFFLISRYEECVRRDIRDQHGRFIGKESAASRHGFLQEPIVECYGDLLRDMLEMSGHEVKMMKPGFSHIYLTHDIDHPWMYSKLWKINSIKLFIMNTLRLIRQKELKRLFEDPYYTFPWLIEYDGKVKEKYGEIFSSLYFIMTCGRSENDEGYVADLKRTKKLLEYLKRNDAEFGIHISYQAGNDISRIQNECNAYKSVVGTMATRSRNHYLMSKEPEDFNELINSGITDDFTMGFADGGGFRLGTCRAVKWIDPMGMKLTDLVLHPLLVTESKICNPDFMGLSFSEALDYYALQIDKIKKYNGEFIVLFHNSSLIGNTEYRYKELYAGMISILLKGDRI